jgi:endogenous inhibitor of DNA gyrase (YacG/DUF329 family)
VRVLHGGRQDFTAWWHGVIVQCRECGQAVVFEVGDDESRAVRVDNARLWYSCTRCGQDVVVERARA